MLLRKFQISDSSINISGLGLHDALAACMDYKNVRSTIEHLSKHIEYRKFKPRDGTSTASAVSAYLNKGTIAAEKVILEQTDDALLRHDLEAEIKRSREFSIILDAICDYLGRHFPDLRSTIPQEATSAILKEASMAVSAVDPSRPIDVLRGAKVLVAYSPSLPDGMSLPDLTTAFWKDGGPSSSLNIKPDVVFETFLRLANISSSAWIDAVEAYHGVRLDEYPYDDDQEWEIERYRSWSSLDVETDPEREALADVFSIVEAVDNCSDGFTPMLAFEADSDFLMNREWSGPMEVTGGVLGLHNYQHGSGCPLRFEQTVTVDAKKDDIKVIENMENDISSVHAFTRLGFLSKQIDKQIPPKMMC